MSAPREASFVRHVDCPSCRGVGSVLTFDGAAFRKARSKADLSLREVGKRAGVSAMYVCDIELGRRQPSDRVRNRLLRAIGVVV